MRCPKGVKKDQVIVNRVIAGQEEILQDVETVPPIGEIRYRGGVELIFQEPLVQNVMAGNMCKGLQMVTWLQDLRQDHIATTEMADAIVRETDVRQTKLDNNHSAHAQTHKQELVLNAMAWDTS